MHMQSPKRPAAGGKGEASGNPVLRLRVAVEWRCLHKLYDISEAEGRVWAPSGTAEIGDELEASHVARKDGERASGGVAVERSQNERARASFLVFSSPRL